MTNRGFGLVAVRFLEKPKIFLFLFAAAVIVFSGTQGIEKIAFSWSGVAYAQESWKNEFEDICSKTQDAMMFTPDELKPLIEKLDETQRKVYSKRLQLCRDLLAFVLESKEKK